MGHKSDTVDGHLDEIASRQHGVASLRQLESVGLSRYGVAKRAKSGRLHRIHQGVYAVGHRGGASTGASWAALLACGEGAVLSHGFAAVLWKLLKPLDGPVHVSAQPPGVVRSAPASTSTAAPPLMRSLLTTSRDNIPVTTVSRTIEDLRRTSFPPRLLRRAIRQAELMGLRLDGIETDHTRSDLETYFLGLCRRYGLAVPEVKVKRGTRDTGSKSPGGGSPGTQHGAEPKAIEASAKLRNSRRRCSRRPSTGAL
jgi:hypothetical protein